MAEEEKNWDSLAERERRALLAFAGIWKSDEIIFHEATLKWKQLLPSTREKILEIKRLRESFTEQDGI